MINNDFSQRIVYLNGNFIPINQAHISVLDRGFLFGDGVYEVIPMFNGKLFRAEQHLQRLQRSLQSIQLNYTVNTAEWLTIFDSLLKQNVQPELSQMIYLQITRGAATDRAHLFPNDIKPTIFAQTSPFKPTSIEELSAGAAAITVDDIRWQWCHIKAITLLPNVLFTLQAKNKDAKEAILIRDGNALEGTSSNLFIVKNGVIITPPLSPNILAGVTRELILELAKTHDLPFAETKISETALREADEIWMTGSVKEILPITRLDDKPVGSGKVGPVWHKLIKLYSSLKSSKAQL